MSDPCAPDLCQASLSPTLVLAPHLICIRQLFSLLLVRSSVGAPLAPPLSRVGFVLCFLWASTEVDERQITAVRAPVFCTIKEEKQARTYRSAVWLGSIAHKADNPNFKMKLFSS